MDRTITTNTPHRNICFVTGTRAEFGLMVRTLAAIRDHPSLQLQLVVTGMHLSKQHGRSIDQIRNGGWSIDAIVPWKSTDAPGAATGRAITQLTTVFDRLNSDIVLVVGDRVEGFAAATAAHLSGRIVAHVHGGDRALGQVDDCLRHAITKLSHIHFPATVGSKKRLLKLGEDRWRVHRVGSPGLDGIIRDAMSSAQLRQTFPTLARHKFVLLVLHPTDADEQIEFERAQMVRAAIGSLPCVVVYPNNDPGYLGITRCWKTLKPTYVVCPTVDRPTYLGLLRDAAMLVGNSSSGIIEAASFGTPVIDIGDRQSGREHGDNVYHAAMNRGAIAKAIAGIYKTSHSKRIRGTNIYGESNTADKIVRVLSSTKLDHRLRRKLIAY